mmetsp:Transcript_7027/g.16074  ORF Transcript_7027/g.16074 Transcript_7027/m.16074 type:complete len:109 (-) Transcript_7027:78-404(-)
MRIPTGNEEYDFSDEPFYSEFYVFQGDSGSIVGKVPVLDLKNLVCSSMSRLYSDDRKLMQATTGFFTFKSFMQISKEALAERKREAERAVEEEKRREAEREAGESEEK